MPHPQPRGHPHAESTPQHTTPSGEKTSAKNYKDDDRDEQEEQLRLPVAYAIPETDAEFAKPTHQPAHNGTTK